MQCRSVETCPCYYFSCDAKNLSYYIIMFVPYTNRNTMSFLITLIPYLLSKSKLILFTYQVILLDLDQPS